MNHILYFKGLNPQNLFCGHGVKMPAVLNICLIIYWNVNVLWILRAMQD